MCVLCFFSYIHFFNCWYHFHLDVHHAFSALSRFTNFHYYYWHFRHIQFITISRIKITICGAAWQRFGGKSLVAKAVHFLFQSPVCPPPRSTPHPIFCEPLSLSLPWFFFIRCSTALPAGCMYAHTGVAGWCMHVCIWHCECEYAMFLCGSSYKCSMYKSSLIHWCLLLYTGSINDVL